MGSVVSWRCVLANRVWSATCVSQPGTSTVLQVSVLGSRLSVSHPILGKGLGEAGQESRALFHSTKQLDIRTVLSDINTDEHVDTVVRKSRIKCIGSKNELELTTELVFDPILAS